MPGITGNPNPSIKLISGSLNGENNAALGSPLASPSGMIVSQYGGFLGAKLNYDADDAGKMSSSTVGLLYGGTYMMVKTSATLPNPSRGRLVFWDLTVAEDAYQVAQDETQNGGQPLIAGVLLNTVTPGNYTIIQIGGRATVQCRTTVSSASRNIIWAGAGSGVDNATVDGANSATAVSTLGTVSSFLNAYIGLGEAVAANGSLIIVDLKPIITRQ